MFEDSRFVVDLHIECFGSGEVSAFSEISAASVWLQVYSRRLGRYRCFPSSCYGACTVASTATSACAGHSTYLLDEKQSSQFCGDLGCEPLRQALAQGGGHTFRGAHCQVTSFKNERSGAGTGLWCWEGGP